MPTVYPRAPTAGLPLVVSMLLYRLVVPVLLYRLVVPMLLYRLVVPMLLYRLVVTYVVVQASSAHNTYNYVVMWQY